MSLNLKGVVPKPPEPTQQESKVQEKSAKKEKKAAPPAIIKSANLMEVLAAIRKDKGAKSIIPASQMPHVSRLPTGNFEFDFYTGGGFPRGRYSIIYGPEQSWKTGIALQAIASAQKEPGPCNKCVYVNIENAHDTTWDAKLGVDIDALQIANPAYGEEAVDMVDALMRADDLNCLVVDSMAGLISVHEVEKSTENYDIGTSALLIKRMCNKMMVAFGEQAKKGHFPTIILINQRRFKPGVQFGDPETMPGGEAQKFLATCRIRFYGKDIIDKATNAKTGRDVHAVFKKARMPVRAASFDFKVCTSTDHDYLKVGDTDSFITVKQHLQALNLLVKVSAGYQIPTITEPCKICIPGKPLHNCGLCGGSGVTFAVFKSMALIQDRYYSDWKFKLAMQKLVIDAYGEKEMLMIEEPTLGAAQATPGDVVEVEGE